MNTLKMECFLGCYCVNNECNERAKYPFITKLNTIKLCVSNLTELDLSACDLKEVPEFISNLDKLSKLNLSSNNLIALPLSFTKLQHVSDINLSHNAIQELPQCIINGMSTIEVLDISYNLLSSISFRPACIHNLKTLNLKNNSNLCCLPKWLWSIDCNALEALDISFTKCLEHVESDPYMNMFGISNHLCYLNVANTNSQTQDFEFIKHLKTLKHVVFDNTTLNRNNCNYLNDIPLIFNYRFKSITSLSMSNVTLSSIRKEIYFILPNLTNLYLPNNEIFSLPITLGEMTNLEVCDFSNNQIFTIPECFKNLKNLKKLVLNNNQISVFPIILEDMINLEWLDLYANKLSKCPSWDKNPNMKFVDFEQNLFSINNENYNKLLENVRKSTDLEKRLIGAVCVDSNSSGLNDTDSYESSSSSYEESTFSSDSLPSSHEDQSSEHLCMQLKEELWEENTYEMTSALFDPKEFEMELFNELSKLQLSIKEGVKTKSPKKNSSHLGNEHYFCPGDDYSKIL